MQLSKKNLFSALSTGLFRFSLILSLVTIAFTSALPAPVQAKPPKPNRPLAILPNTYGTLGTARTFQTATLLQNGKVLAAGGAKEALVNSVKVATPLATAELFDPATGLWKQSANLLNTARKEHTATVLLNGMVLLVGGCSSSSWGDCKSDASATPLASAELYNPATDKFTPAAALSVARYGHTATLLKDGSVLVAGGEGVGGTLSSAQIYDPKTDSWSTDTPNLAARAYHTANLLADGTVIVIGGENGGNALNTFQVYDPVGKSWSSVDPNHLVNARYAHTATVLNNGSILVVGGRDGSDALNKAERLTLSGGSWTAAGTGDLTTARFGHTATLMPDGNLLVAGGESDLQDDAPADTCEEYQVDNSVFGPADSLSTPRAGQTATLLPDSQVLVVGGSNTGGSQNTSDLYNTQYGGWYDNGIPGSLSAGRYSPVATTLNDGRVLVLGGQDSYVALDSVDIFDPDPTHLHYGWTAAKHMLEPRNQATATLLANGNVLVAGGQGVGEDRIATAELYDPIADKWTYTGSMHTDRAQHTATLLTNGQVMVVGGQNRNGDVKTVEFYSPATGTWTVGNPLNVARHSHTATLLQDGSVLVVGGQNSVYLNSTEIYTPSSGTWWETSGTLTQPRSDHTATLLPNGKVLIVGGSNNGVDFYGCQMYDPAKNNWSFLPGPLNQARSLHSATLLKNGKVLVAGGLYHDLINPSHPPVTATDSELYDPATNQWTVAGDLVNARYSHAAALLPDGQVLIAGGRNNTTFTASTELFDPGNAYDPTWQPVLGSLPDKVILTHGLSVTGALLRGYNFMESSSGTGSSSASNYPLIQLRRLDNNQTIWLLPDLKLGFSDTAFTSQPVTNIAAGPVSVTVFVNGIPSASKIINLVGMNTYAPQVLKIPPPKKHFFLPIFNITAL